LIDRKALTPEQAREAKLRTYAIAVMGAKPTMPEDAARLARERTQRLSQFTQAMEGARTAGVAASRAEAVERLVAAARGSGLCVATARGLAEAASSGASRGVRRR
jgi:alkylhydroperoxidase family enzyme